MKILVINGDCIQRNSSANLCHLAYIKGLVDAGYDVSLLSAEGRDYTLDSDMKIPPEVKQYTYCGMTFYEKISQKKNVIQNSSKIKNITESGKSKKGAFGTVIRKAKDFILYLYGVHGIYSKFYKKAQSFNSDEYYDYILSLSTPVVSHLLAYRLLKTEHIKGRKWIQIWEDPWYSDAYGCANNKRIFYEEKKILSLAEYICYVSPLTLKKQQKLYPESAKKMYWQPLPQYYRESQTEYKMFDHNVYGYFGDYDPLVRNLKPFYKAALRANIEVNICGNPSGLFLEQKKIHIHPRLTLSELKPIEEKTNVLIFLCNQRGGQIPGKIYQYSATNKVILFIMDGTSEEKKVLKEFFGSFNRYIFCENTEESIFEAIEKIETGDFGIVDNKPIKEFDPQIIVQKVLECK